MQKIHDYEVRFSLLLLLVGWGVVIFIFWDNTHRCLDDLLQETDTCFFSSFFLANSGMILCTLITHDLGPGPLLTETSQAPCHTRSLII